MEPVSVISLGASVSGVVDVIARSLKGLYNLQNLYKSADAVTARIIDWLHMIRHVLDETREWMNGLKNQSEYANLLTRIDYAIGCCGATLETLYERIKALQRHTDNNKLTQRGKLAYMRGQSEMKMVRDHLGNQLQALNALMTVAQGKTLQERNKILQDDETLSALKRIQDDSSSYRENNSESASAITICSAASEHTELLNPKFAFENDLFSSRVYKNIVRNVCKEQSVRRTEIGLTEISSIISESTTTTNVTEVQDKGKRVERRESLSEKVSDGKGRASDRKSGDSDASRHGKSSDKASLNSLEHERDHLRINLENSGETVKTENTETGKQDSMTSSTEEQNLTLIPKPMSIKYSDAKIDEQRDAETEKLLKDWKQLESDTYDVLLLGMKASGKDTLCKTFKLGYQGTYDLRQREYFKDVIYQNLSDGVRIILILLESLNIPLRALSPQGLEKFAFKTEALRAATVYAIFALQEEPFIQKCMGRSEFQMDISIKYLLSNAERICRSDYIPNDEDILHAYDKSKGARKFIFISDEKIFRISNIEGAQIERKNWVYCLKSTCAILFTADLSAYDDEDSMQDSLKAFELVVDSPWLRKTKVILLFTKTDLFRAKLPQSPLKDYFPEYNGRTFGEARHYLLRQYTNLDGRGDGLLYTHFVCLVDKRHMMGDLETIKDNIVQPSNLKMRCP